MPNLSNLPDDATLVDLFKRYPRLDLLTNMLTQEILRGPGELSPAQRETLFAFGSGMNACHFCHGAHTAIAEALGADAQLIRSAVEDLDSAALDPKMRPLFAYVRKLTLTPSRVTRADADAVRAVGWSDQALHEAITVCALHNFFNRWVDGSGVDAPDAWLQGVGAGLALGSYLDVSAQAG